MWNNSELSKSPKLPKYMLPPPLASHLTLPGNSKNMRSCESIHFNPQFHHKSSPPICTTHCPTPHGWALGGQGSKMAISTLIIWRIINFYVFIKPKKVQPKNMYTWFMRNLYVLQLQNVIMAFTKLFEDSNRMEYVFFQSISTCLLHKVFFFNSLP